MPRLKSSTYLEHRRFLDYAWDHFKIIYGVSSIKQQFDLHRYYQTDRDLPDAALLANREALTAADPSLPNRAGKAFAQLNGAFRIAYEQSNGKLLRFHQAVWRLVPRRGEPKSTQLKRPASSRHLRAVPVMNRTVDVQLLAKALRMQVDQDRSAATDQTDHAA